MSMRFTDIKNKLCLLQMTKTNSYGEIERLYVQYDASQEPIYSMHELKQATRALPTHGTLGGNSRQFSSTTR